MLPSTTGSGSWTGRRGLHNGCLGWGPGLNAPSTIWGSQHEIATQAVGSPEGEKKKKEENFPAKVPKALMCSLAHSQNKGLREHQRGASGLHIGTPQPPKAERQVCDGQSRKASVAAILVPETAVSPNCEQAPSCQPRLRGPLDGWHLPGGLQPQVSAPEDTHTWDGALAAHPRTWWGLGRCLRRSPTWTVRSSSTWPPEQPGPGKGTRQLPSSACVPWQGAREPERLRPGEGMERSPGRAQPWQGAREPKRLRPGEGTERRATWDGALAEQPGAWAV